MPLRVGDEPIPGYRLEAFLGAGSYGEVWRASGPGDVPCAMKFIRLDSQSGLKEFRAIRLVKKLRHPNLCPVQATWLRDDDGHVLAEGDAASGVLRPEGSRELVIAMGLGEKTLARRLDETRGPTGAGLPPRELLRYLEDAARGIDHLNDPVHDLGDGPVPIVHCDIKPANLLVVGGGVQVCDYGVAKALSKDSRKTFAAGTPAYAAPELINNEPGRGTDQYALAITYHELRTGALPFEELKAVVANLTGQLDLSRLPPEEEAVIRRATSRRPEDRYPTCLDLIEELKVALGVSLSTGDLTRAAAPLRVAASAATESAVAVRGKQANALRATPAATRTPLDNERPPPGAGERVGSVWWLAAALGLLFVLAGATAYVASRPDGETHGSPGPRSAPADHLARARELLDRADPDIKAGRSELERVPDGHPDRPAADALRHAWGEALAAQTEAIRSVTVPRELARFAELYSVTPPPADETDRTALAAFVRRQFTVKVRNAVLCPTLPKTPDGWRGWLDASRQADDRDPVVAAFRLECWAELTALGQDAGNRPDAVPEVLKADDPLSGYPEYAAALARPARGPVAEDVTRFLATVEAARPAWLNADRVRRIKAMAAGGK